MAIVYNKDKNGNTLSIDEMIRKFKKKVQQEGILLELKKRECFVPKSVENRERQAAAQRRTKLQQSKQNKNR